MLRSALAVALLTGVVGAQSIRGVVVDRGDTPLPGVVTQLLDSTSAVTARALTNEQGEFRLVAPRPGTYRIHTLRIGYRPSTGESFALGAAQEVAQRIVLSGVAIALDTVRVADRSSCRMASDSAAATFALWEQVRTALTAAQLTGRAATIDATIVGYERFLDAGTKRVLGQSANVRSGLVTQPWAALPPEELRRVGYVTGDGTDTTTFYAPGLDALLADEFVADHCFRLVAGPDRSRLGIEFEPSASRRRVAGIRGTLWIDRASSELRSMEFRYANVPNVTVAGRVIERLAGGGMDFLRLRNGTWVISRWEIRMPVLAAINAQRTSSGSRLSAIQIDDARVAAIKVAGGDLASALQAADTLWARPPLVLHGNVMDSVSGAPIRAARISVVGALLDAETDSTGRFVMAGMLPGEYVLEVRTPSLDSASAAHQSALVFSDSGASVRVRVPNASQLVAALCRAGGARLEQPGVLFGAVRSSDSTSPRNVRVIAEWRDAAAGRQARWLDTRTTPQGAFRLCGVPLGTPVVLRAESDAASTGPLDVFIQPSGRFARADLTLDRPRAVAQSAVFTGVVVDSMEAPIAGADVAIPELGLTVVSNDRGRFRIANVSPGEHRILVRRVGFGAADARIDFPSNQTVDRRVILSRFVTLDSVIVTARTRDIRMDEFEENRKLGLGHFLTRDDLAKAEGRTLSGVVEQMVGVKMVQGLGNATWVASSVPTRTIGNRKCVELEDGGGDCDRCYAVVYLDNIVLFRGNGDRAPVPNLRRFAPAQIEAIEYYANAAQTPGKYNTLNSQCGVLVIHTRR